MKLHRISLENYRIHKALTVEFDDQRNLIGGHNETGKSTLVEAAHRALFLRYKTGGEVQKQMVSKTESGHPKVTLDFSIGADRYSIEKTFSGGSGSALLTNQTGDTWMNDEAENKLRALLQVNEYGSGAAFKNQWAHLWITQGSSADNPSEQASNYANELLNRLEKEGAAALQQSPQDQSAAEYFSEKYDVYYTATGRPKTGSPANEAEIGAQQSREILEGAESNLRILESSRREFIQADNDGKDLVPKLEEYTNQLAKLTHEINQAKTYQDQWSRKSDALAILKKEFEDLSKKDEEITTLEAELNKTKEDLESFSTSSAALKTRLDSARETSNKLDPNALRQPLADARLLVEFCKQQVATLEHADDLKLLAQNKQKLIPLQEKIEKYKSAIAPLTKISEPEVTELFSLETKLISHREQLATISTRIEIETPDATFLSDGSELTESTLTISRQTELRFGDPKTPTIIKITPGGSEGLQRLEGSIRELEEQLESKLHQTGFPTPLAAQESRTKRETLKAELDAIENEALTLGGIDLLARFQTATEKLEQQRNSLEQLRSQFTTAPPCSDDITEARDQYSQSQTNLAALTAQDDELHKQSTSAKQAYQNAEKESKEHNQKRQDLTTRSSALQAKFDTLIDEHGDQQSRTKKLKETRQIQNESTRETNHLRNQLDEINPAELKREETRLTRAIEKTREAITDAETKKAVAQSQLSKTTDRDPVEVVAEAEAAHAQAESEQRRISNQAKAHHLLHHLFQEEKKEMTEQLTSPLAQRVENYLQPIFGNDVRVTLEYGENNTFQSLALARNGHRFDFSTLSGGTREQLAAAFRLALAEILAEDHNGSLPLVFDDAFTNSDPERVEQLQKMLDIAAERGLQLILLSCCPNQYAALGAKQTLLAS